MTKKKKLTLYKDLLIDRIRHIPLLSADEQVSLIEKIDKLEQDVNAIQCPIDEVKRIKRKKGDRTSLSLRVTDEVPSIKVFPLGAGGHSRVHLSVDGLPGADADHIYATKVKEHYLLIEETPENTKENLLQLAYTEHEIHLLRLMGLYVRHVVRYKGLTTDAKTGVNYRVQKVYIDLKYIPGVTFYQAAKAGETGGKKLNFAQALDRMGRISKQLGTVHGAGYFYGDMHRRNLMVTGDFFDECDLTLYDFNLSRPFGHPLVIEPVKQGSREQIPPECCDKSIVYFNRSTDIYALGNIFKVILGLTVCTPEQRASLRAMYHEMRHPNPDKRPTLQHVRQCLNEMAESGLGYLPYAVPDEVQNEVIDALDCYIIGLKSTYSLMDSKRTQKINFLKTLITELREAPAWEMFQGKLKQGFIDFIRSFIIPNVRAYRRNFEPDLRYFAKAIHACGQQIDLVELMAFMKDSLASQQQFSPKIEEGIWEVLSPTSSTKSTARCLKLY